MCSHGVFFPEPEYHKELGIDKMSVQEIRQKYPRLSGKCPKGCGFYGAAYASFMHYMMGDW